jgi:voltage-gated potassium channel Kch
MKKMLFVLCLFTGLVSMALAQEGDRGLSVVARQVTESNNFNIGRQYAVVIGIDRYSEWQPLSQARAEAESIRNILMQQYYMDEIIELYDEDASAENIMTLFSSRLKEKVGLRDSLFIFYAGHGHLDESKTGYWIPVDGSSDHIKRSGWIANAQIRAWIAGLKAQRILIVADSCFSGDLLDVSRSATPEIDNAYFKKALSLTARQVLTSGASETVPDQSEFGRQFVAALERNTDPYIDALSIYDRIRRGVSKTLPLFGTLPGNELGASFVLFRRENPTKGVLAVSGAYRASFWLTTQEGERLDAANRYELDPGTYTLHAMLDEDVEESWQQELVIQAGSMLNISIPMLSFSNAYKLLKLDKALENLRTRLQVEERVVRANRQRGAVMLTISLASAGLGVYSYLTGSEAYLAYQAATDAALAASLRGEVEMWTGLAYAGAGVAGTGLLISLPMLFKKAPKDTITQIRNHEAQREQLLK